MAVFGDSSQDDNNLSEDNSPLSASSLTSSSNANSANGSNGQLSSPATSDDLMEAVERLEKYSLSDVIFHRYVLIVIRARRVSTAARQCPKSSFCLLVARGTRQVGLRAHS